MIVRSYASSCLLITQPDHAALAGRIMDVWATRGLRDAPQRASILRAVSEHDVGWREVDSAPLVDEANGQILDFISAPAPSGRECGRARCNASRTIRRPRRWSPNTPSRCTAGTGGRSVDRVFRHDGEPAG